MNEALTAAKLIDLVLSWPLGVVLVLILVSCCIGPWLAVIYFVRASDKRAADHELKAAENLGRLEKVVEAGWKAYQDNVELVKSYEALTRQVCNINNQLVDVVHLNTQAQTGLIDAVKNNLFCPQARAAIGK